MPRNASTPGVGARGRGPGPRGEGPAALGKWRIALGALAAANLIAAGFLLFPPGGSADDLGRRIGALQKQAVAKKAVLGSNRQRVAAGGKRRNECAHVLKPLFLARGT